MKHVVVIGGGVAGINALERLRKKSKSLRITLVDKRTTSDFLPLLPDMLWRDIHGYNLEYDLAAFCRRNQIDFKCASVQRIDIAQHEIHTSEDVIEYDELVIACGTQTCFYGNNRLKKVAYTLESVGDAWKLRTALNDCTHDAYIVVGGGYVGIEVACALKSFILSKRTSGLGNAKPFNPEIVVVEKADRLLPMLPIWISNYVKAYLKKQNITVVNCLTVSDAQDKTVSLSDGKVYVNSLLVWSAGVCAQDFITSLQLKKNRQGRVSVDETFSIAESVYVIGDAAVYEYKGKALRMSYKCAKDQGRYVADYIISRVKGAKQPKPYRPFDPGYIVPMGAKAACGNVFGFRIKGCLFLHYIVGFYLLRAWKNKLALFKAILKR